MAEYVTVYENCNSCIGGIQPTHTHNEGGTVTYHMTEPCGIPSCEDGWKAIYRIDITGIVSKLDTLDAYMDTIETKIDALE